MFCLPVLTLHSYNSDIFIYLPDRSDYSAAGKYVDRSWEYINRLQTHECGIGTEAAQFPEKEYINGIFVAVHSLNEVWIKAQRILQNSCQFPSTELVFFYANPHRLGKSPPTPPPPHPWVPGRNSYRGLI
jgi:hypothetical protein